MGDLGWGPREGSSTFGRTIQLYLVDGNIGGLLVASLKGWTGSIVVARNSTLPKLLSRPEARRTGVYMLFGPDPQNTLENRVYIGEADDISMRLPQSAKERGFWEMAAVITASDESLTKGHVRYLEARLIEFVNNSDRVNLDNIQQSSADRRYLPESDVSDMEYFLNNLESVLPVVGLDIFRQKIKIEDFPYAEPYAYFVIDHKRGAHARAREIGEEFLVLSGSTALKDANYSVNQYAPLKQTLIENGVLEPLGELYRFTRDFSFSSPTAAAAVVLDRNANGRTEWKVEGTDITYHDWQSAQVTMEHSDE